MTSKPRTTTQKCHEVFTRESTLEYLKLPYDVSGQVLTKSSLARRFITIETAPWIHPLYRGCLTLEIANSSNIAVPLRPGESIGQLVLFSVDFPDSEPGVRLDNGAKDRIEGTYFGPVSPELPMRPIALDRRAVIVGEVNNTRSFAHRCVRAYCDGGWLVHPVSRIGNRQLRIRECQQPLEVLKSVLEAPQPVYRLMLYLSPDEAMRSLEDVVNVQPRELFLPPGVDTQEVIAKARKLGLKPTCACGIVHLGISPFSIRLCAI